ncbi:MAG: Hydrolase, alpha/beta fold family protein [Moraxellaceae bacterium]|jgi:lysophospholipase|nr:Hydrolase, alpha/beta fold family protein [Moraxellaceae bacterium]
MTTAALLESAAPPDMEAVRRELLRLDLSLYAPLRGALAQYGAYYGIDFERSLPGTRHHLGWFEAQGYRIAANVFLPPNAQGTVFILHGYLDHAGLYKHLIRDCLERNHAVFIFDLPGHGLSSGARVDIPDFGDYQQVLAEALTAYGAQLPRPFHGVGQSTGAAILMDHVLTACAEKKTPAFRKLLLLAPLVRPVQWAKIRFGWWLIHHFKKTVPRVYRTNSSDETFLRFVKQADPLQDDDVPMGWVGALKRWVARMHRLPPADFPVLLVQGERDETVEWRYNLGFVRRHFRVEQEQLLPQASHQLANERADLRVPVHDALAVLLSGQ